MRSGRLWASVAAIFAAITAGLVALIQRPKRVGHALIVTAEQHTVNDPECGVRSIQEADLILPDERMAELWTPRSLERLARTYWRWLSRATLGLVRVHYSDDGRQVRALGFIPLLTFKKPEYEMDADRGIVRWRIDRGVLVAKRGRGGAGYLEIEVSRRPSEDYPGSTIVHAEVEVANFYPAIASSISNWVYENTQSRIHVLVTHSFLRSLARLDLSESKVGRFAKIEDLPDPVRARDRSDIATPA
jgi:putative ubiquitin-RnfH superfamily antitoxin RatB of RatAB toxin-antitoxin module